MSERFFRNQQAQCTFASQDGHSAQLLKLFSNQPCESPFTARMTYGGDCFGWRRLNAASQVTPEEHEK